MKMRFFSPDSAVKTWTEMKIQEYRRESFMIQQITKRWLPLLCIEPKFIKCFWSDFDHFDELWQIFSHLTLCGCRHFNVLYTTNDNIIIQYYNVILNFDIAFPHSNQKVQMQIFISFFLLPSARLLIKSHFPCVVDYKSHFFNCW